jgi:hypothetical protein
MFVIYRTEEALKPLRETWEQASTTLREQLIEASRRIDQRLQEDPDKQGESREGQMRVLLEPPLGVLFEVDAAQQLVRIVRAWACPSFGTTGE